MTRSDGKDRPAEPPSTTAPAPPRSDASGCQSAQTECAHLEPSTVRRKAPRRTGQSAQVTSGAPPGRGGGGGGGGGILGAPAPEAEGAPPPPAFAAFAASSAALAPPALVCCHLGGRTADLGTPELSALSSYSLQGQQSHSPSGSADKP